MKNGSFVNQEGDASHLRYAGGGKFRYRAVPGWGQLPPGHDFGDLRDVVGIASDSKRRAYVFNRGKIPIIIFDHEGRFIGSWGEKQFVRPHGIYIGSDDSIYCTGDVDQTVRKFSTDGRLLMQLGVSGKASDTGAIPFDWRSIKRAGPPFNMPTNVAVAPDGTLLVSDGYGNARV